MLPRDPETSGFRGPVWTRRRVAAVRRLACGVLSQLTQVGRLLNALLWSPQKPMRRSRTRDEAAMAR